MSDDKDQIERWIDEGVQRYAKAEPPLGMESRVLAGLQQRQPRRWWRPWMIAVPVAALLAVVIGLSLQEKTKPQPAAPQVATSAPSTVAPPPVAKQVPPQQERRTIATRTKREALTGVSTMASSSRPETFPTPAKASEQELLLERLAQNRSVAQAVEASADEETPPIVISRIAIDPVNIPLLPGPNPQGE